MRQANKNDDGAIWNPNAAINWSALFSPVLGSYLHLKNWEALNEQSKATSARRWLYASIGLLAVLLLTLPFADDDVVRWVGQTNFVFLLIWYFAAARPQARYVKAKFGADYPRKPWSRPLLVASGAAVVYFVVAGAISTGAVGMTGNPLIGRWERDGAVLLSFTSKEAQFFGTKCAVDRYRKEVVQISGQKVLSVAFNCLAEGGKVANPQKEPDIRVLVLDEDRLLAFSWVWHRVK